MIIQKSTIFFPVNYTALWRIHTQCIKIPTVDS